MAVFTEKQQLLQSQLAQVARDADRIGRTVRIMEVCGTHTVAIQRSGLRQLLPKNIKLISGPGCPVCVTPTGYIDALITLAKRGDILIATYGDMVRVPGSSQSLAEARAEGADARVVSSAFQAYELALANPGRNVVFAAVGFETTTPATADILLRAKKAELTNLFALCAHKLVIPAMQALLAGPKCAVDGFLCPGHVSVMLGYKAYEPIAAQFGRPCVVAGFEPRQIIDGIARIVAQIADGTAKVDNVYKAAVGPDRHQKAWEMIERVFMTADAEWRALGSIPQSGLVLNDDYRQFDAARVFDIVIGDSIEPAGCRCGEVIQGLIDPAECALFGKRCTPDDPVGPCMVSSEGACQAWFKYGHLEDR